jgi:hypothetical protein
LVLIWPETSRLTDYDDLALFHKKAAGLVEKAKTLGFRSVEATSIPLQGFDTVACNQHYSVADHEKLSRRLIEKLKIYPQFQ